MRHTGSTACCLPIRSHTTAAQALKTRNGLVDRLMPTSGIEVASLCAVPATPYLSTATADHKGPHPCD